MIKFQPDWRLACLPVALFVVVLCTGLSSMAQEPPEEEKTSREILQLEAELLACQEELAVLKNPPPIEDDQYLQEIDNLQQRIDEVGK